MDITQISQLIGGLGFPIVMALILNNDLKEERKAHKEEVDSLRAVIEKNTEVLIRVEETIDND